MAGINTVGSFVYSWIEASWQVSAVVMKYFVLTNLGYLILNNNLDFQMLEEKILETAKPVVLFTAVLGLFFSLAGISITPFFKLFSQVVAVVTLGFIFWRY